jgi:hypothetical protein
VVDKLVVRLLVAKDHGGERGKRENWRQKEKKIREGD